MNKKFSALNTLGMCALCAMLAVSCSKEKNADMQAIQKPAAKQDAEIVLREAGGDFGYPKPRAGFFQDGIDLRFAFGKG